MHRITFWFKNNYLLLLLLWFALLLVFSYSWLPGGLDVDACNYSLVAKHTLLTNTWFKLYDPTINDTFYYHFPLYIWITALFFKLFGISVFSAVLFSSLSAVVLVAILYYLGKLLANEWVGFFAGSAYLMTNHVLRLARLARMDIPVSMFITAALFCFILAQKRTRLYYLLFGIFTSLAIFTKDIFGVAPLAIALAYFIFTGRWKEIFHPAFLGGVLLIFAPLITWIWLDGNTLFERWYKWNFLHLYRSPFFKIPWYYYIKAIAEKYFYFLPFAVYGGYLGIKRARRNKQTEFYVLIIWALIFPLAFSFGRQKLHYFIIAMYPASALLVGVAIDSLIRDAIKPRVATVFKYLLIIFATVMLCFPLDIRSRRFDEVVTMAPAIEGVLKQLPKYEFVVYNYDGAAVLWYVGPLSGITKPEKPEDLLKLLEAGTDKPRLLFIDEDDFAPIPPAIRQRFRIILKYRTRLLAVSGGSPDMLIELPSK